MKALGKLEDALGKYLEALKSVVKGPVVIVDYTFDHKLHSRVHRVASRYGNYFTWCSSHRKLEPGVQLLAVAESTQYKCVQ
ncbi:hypothetical protein HS1genome_1873 [Sulfodiicoccus acidiphilus]|uniref:Uncharacterized protein n=1 Tax=Sulfodiicoccus acidiphilus TaxID=1670455 RepID=A0A348B5N2_9CREN|nr:hypothetical protein HS1genome_1873 [Sulfodiicoccus acidiphilus]GGT92820.1 hypothetical protein GCM10007116_08250 [Sulfodiicoccus acidiphilus]